MAQATFFAAAVGALFLALAPGAKAQQANPTGASDAPKSVPATTRAAQSNLAQPPQLALTDVDALEPNQPVSLGDLARAVRANKKSEAKAVKIVDNDEIPSVGDRSGDSRTDRAASKAKVVLMDFWATWCGPCRESLPDLKRLMRSIGSDKLEVISVSEDTDERAWSDFTSSNGMNWQQQRDASHRLMQRYGVSALPTYVLLGDNGAVLQRYEGEDTQNSLVDRIGPDIQRALAASR